MSPNDLDDRIRDVVTTVARTAPDPLPFAEVLSHHLSPECSAERTRHRVPLVAAAAGLALILVIAGAIVWLRSDGGGNQPQPAGPGGVVHEVVAYSQRTDIRCPNGAPDVSGEFDRMTFETWGDETNGTYRMQVTYPDGTTRDVITIGSPYYPSAIFTRGAIRGRQLGCNDSVGTLQYEPGQGSLWSLRPMAAIPQMPGGETKVPQYDDLGVQVPGDHEDSRRRAAELWRQTSTGTTGTVGGRMYDVRQITEWFVDPSSRGVLEQRWHEHIDGIGDAWSTRTLVRRDSVSPNEDLFSLGGYDTFAVLPDPSLPSSTVSPTTSPTQP